MRHEPVHQSFTRNAVKWPNETAISFGGASLSYSDLLTRSNQIANLLLSAGAGRCWPVAILCSLPPDIISTIIGVLKAGCAFVAVDTQLPVNKLASMFGVVEPPLIIADRAHLELATRLGQTAGARLICFEDHLDQPDTDPEIATEPDQLSYIYFTSGSTGVPKAIAGRLKGIDHFINWEIEHLGLQPGVKVSHLLSPVFDGSLRDIFVPLVAGGEICVPASREVAADGQRMSRWLSEAEVEVAHLVPTMLREMLNSGLRGVRLDKLKHILLAGEALSPKDVGRWMEEVGDGVRLWNLYGTSETTMAKFYYEVKKEDAAKKIIPIGKPMPGAAAIVMTDKGKPCPQGMIGEIYIRTAYRSLGYYNQAEQTKEVFIKNPFSQDEQDIVYKTGDLGRVLKDGNYECLGRKDNQVKIRGVRVELGEVEEAIRRCAGVKDVAVIDQQRGAEKYLCAYVVMEPGMRAKQVREEVAEELSEVMRPSRYVEMEELPRTISGKVDRRGLPEGGEGGVSEEYVEARSGIEEVIAEIWKEVLGVGRVGVHDNFFELGGHSLRATQVLGRIRGVLGVEISLKELFRRPTVEGLAEEVERRLAGGERREERKIEKVSREGELPLSFAQQRFWFIQELTPNSAAFNLPTNLTLKGELRKEALDAALSSVIARHEVLRTSFPVVNHNPVQLIHPAKPFHLSLVDLSLLDAESRSREVLRLANEEARRPFDLTKGPLLRGLLIKQQEQEHGLLFTLHHIIADGWSVGVVVREISRGYDAQVRGEEVESEELEIQYADYAVWQREWLAGAELERQMSYWKEQLAGAPAFLDLPLDRPRPAVQTYSGARHVFMLPVDIYELLRGLARRERVTTFMVLLTAFKILLHRYSGQQDVIVGTPVANRNRVEIENLIGCFVNSLALRTDFTGEPTFSELLAQVRANSLEAFAHQDLPFEKIVEELQPTRILSHTPLFQVYMVLQNAPRETLKLSGLTLEFNTVDAGSTQYDLTLVFHETGGAIVGVWGYNTDLFDEVTIERMAKHFKKLMEAMVATPELPVSSLPLLDQEAREQVLFDWNRTEVDYPDNATIDQLIESQAKMRPDARAAVCGDNELSYGDLDHQSNLVAGYLKSLGIGRGSRVGVYLDHSLVLLPALLGILKSGAAYVPLDTNHPLNRLEFIVKDASVEYVLTGKAFSERLSNLGVQQISLDSQWSTIASTAEYRSDSTRSPQELAYIIYTSGSTGRPKGVMITHQSLVNYIWWAKQAYLQDESLSFALYSSLAFDLTVTSIFTPLITGNSVVIYDRQGTDFDLTAMLEDPRVGVVKLTPSHLSLIADLDHSRSRVRKLIVGGEAFESVAARRLFESFGGKVDIYNEYGPTEATVGCMIYRYDPRSADRADVPIGRPAANTQIYVLDKNLEPVPENVAGDLYISGDGLALGYLDNSVLTAEKFIPNPIAEGRRMYKSGDLARRLNNGEIEYIGRRDEQVKFHGYRVELNEIRSALNLHHQVKDSVVMLHKDTGANDALVAYYVARQEVEPAQLREHLSEHILKETIPNFFVHLKRLPLTLNGKINHAALPTLEDIKGQSKSVEYVAPQTEVEEIVAGIWATLLGVPQVGRYDNFFQLGGHSLLATQVVSRIRAAFGVSLELRSIFKSPTVRTMAETVEECLRKGEQDEAPPIARVSRDVALPLSFGQQRLWLINQLDEGGAAYNAFTGLRLKGELRKGALDAALSSVIARHEVLRTSFPVVNRNPVQLIHPAQPFHLSEADLSLLDAESRSREVLRLANEEARRPFDLTKGPLIRGLLIKEQKQEHALLFTLHHIVSDGWSVGVIVREISRAYDAQLRGEKIVTEELEIQYADYAVWQREWLSGEELERQVSYWKEQLAGAPAFLDLPLDKPRSSLTEYEGAAKAFMVPQHVLTALKELSRKEQVTLFMTLLAAFDILLMRYTGQDDIVVGSNIANRNRKEIEGLIGFFVNNLVLRTDLSGDPTFSELLHRVREVCLGAYTHQDLPFELVVEAVQPERDSRSTPLFQVLFALQNAPSEALQLPGLTVAPLPIKGGTARFDLMMNLRETPHGLHGTLEFSTDIFYPETIENMVEQFSTLLADIATDPDREISLLSVVRDEETERLGDRFYQDVLAALGGSSM